jgi:hypothetical protein
MLSKLSSLIDDSFGVRCFLPSLLLVLGSFFVHDILSGTDELSRLFSSAPNRVEALAGSAFIALVAWVGGVLISAIQRDIIRILEGYGSFNPFNRLKFFKNAQIREFRSLCGLKNDIISNVQAMESTGTPVDAAVYDKLDEVGLILSTRFPSEERELLPTSFGNTMKSLESYSRIMYGLDGVTGWTRLQAVIPSEYQLTIDDQRLYRDFWANTWIVSFLLLLEAGFYSVVSPFRLLHTVVVVGLLLMVNFTAYMRTTSAACGFGDYVRSAFDLYIDDLGAKLRIPKAQDPKVQRDIWTKATQAYTYRLPGILDSVLLNGQEAQQR